MAFYTPEYPFDPQSLWNSRPTAFTLGTVSIPATSTGWYPAIDAGPYSLSIFVSKSTDKPMRVYGPGGPGSNTLALPDLESNIDYIEIPRWPSDTLGASGDDGHADVMDTQTNRIHSFWQLRKSAEGVYTATDYTWTALNGRGWGTPAQYYQGSRATGVPASAGLIRKHEVADGKDYYAHALAMSMDFSGLSKSPTFVFPATSADGGAENTNFGPFPEGSLMMLPSNFDLNSIGNPLIKKVARTLMRYGAYLVDRNYGTPFAIYVEQGAAFNLHPNGWSNQSASDLRVLQNALRMVTDVTEWTDGNGKVFTPSRKMNILSLRGQWWPLTGPVPTFDTWEQSLTFKPGTFSRVLNATGRNVPVLDFTTMPIASQFAFAVKSTGGANLKLQIVNSGGNVVFDSGYLANDSLTVKWPLDGAKVWLTAQSGLGGGGKITAATLTPK